MKTNKKMKTNGVLLLAGLTAVTLSSCQKEKFSIEDFNPENSITLWADNLPELGNDTVFLNADENGYDGYFYYLSNFGTAPFSIHHSCYYEGPDLAMGQGITYLNYLDFETAGYTNLSCVSIDRMPGKNYFFAQCNGDDWGLPAKIDLIGSNRLYKGVSIWINNSAYAYKAITDTDAGGRGYLKQWTRDDLFRLLIIGENGQKADTVTVDMANGFNVINRWTCIDLSALDSINSIRFILTSTDMGDYGMNTPSCFCFDGLRILPLD